MSSEIAAKADFSQVRYAQCWEDADVLLKGLAIKEGEHCLSIASAGDNALAMLTQSPARIVAIDLNPAQLYCLELRVAAYRMLEHNELLMLVGARPSDERLALYMRCRPLLSEHCAVFWDQQKKLIQQYGIGGVGKFEHYFRIFKNWVLPLCHKKKDIEALFDYRPLNQRKVFFEQVWNNRRWRLLARLFFSQTVMGHLGRDPSFFAHIEGSFSEHISRKVEHALCTLEPVNNPYLHWILTATYGRTLPVALRPENFDLIRNNLDKLSWRLMSIEDFLSETKNNNQFFQKFNLSDIFEYMSQDAYCQLLSKILAIAPSGSRLLYWNMLTPRSAPRNWKNIKPLDELAQTLGAQDNAFFYNRLIVEEVL